MGRRGLQGNLDPAFEIGRQPVRARGRASAHELRQLVAHALRQRIKAARARTVARTDEDRTDFLLRRNFSRADTASIIETVRAEEGRPPESIFDFVQGITAVARDKPHQDARLDMESTAKKVLDHAT